MEQEVLVEEEDGTGKEEEEDVMVKEEHTCLKFTTKHKLLV